MIRVVINLKNKEGIPAPSLRMKKAHELVRDLLAERGDPEDTLKELEELLAQAK
jgi:hypothetical protein